MSDTRALRPQAAQLGGAGLRPAAAVAVAILAALALGAFMTSARMADVWRTGAFFDTDDAMRMAQVRSLLAGQGWYDMTVARMDPPQGVFMHWSRIVDVPLALMMKLFGLFADAPTAEALTRIVFPLVLLAALYAAAARLAALLGGVGAQIAAVALVFTTGSLFTQFVPGRVDHHAPQIVLLVVATTCALAAFDPARARLAAWGGVLSALSLGISLENLPFLIVLAALQPLAFILRGSEQAPALRAQALGLGAGLFVVFVATIGPQHWFAPACDAYSSAHLAAGLVGACCLHALASLERRLPNSGARLGAALAFAVAPLVALRLVAPQCIGDPFVGLDPLVRAVWLDHVAEVRKLLALAAEKPTSAATIGVPVAMAALATLLAALLTRGAQRARLVALSALILVGFAMTFWGVRVYSSVAPLAAVGGAVAALTIAARLGSTMALRGAIAGLLCLPFSPFAYALFLPNDPPGDESTSMSCLRPEAIAPIDALPAGNILAPIDLGSHLIAGTYHAAFAAPYHRNNHGNRLALDALLAAPDAAEKIVRDAGADYVAICPSLKQAQIIAERAPQGLAAQLIAGKAPAWLAPVDVKAAPNVVYRVVR